ncbi:MAG: hypothetical protein ACRDNK_04435, partial [Solirubrobacteraceae bacterium]
MNFTSAEALNETGRQLEKLGLGRGVVQHRLRTGRLVRVHPSKTLTARDVRTHFGIRVTSGARTLLDIAPRLTENELARALNDGRLHRRIYAAGLDELLARLPSHRGTKRVRGLVSTATAAPA